MNNNTETAYEVAKRIFIKQNPQDGNCPLWALKLSKEVANWQKEQDEVKYKALLESHNELLEASKKAGEYMGEFGGGYKIYDNLLTAIENAEKFNQQS